MSPVPLLLAALMAPPGPSPDVHEDVPAIDGGTAAPGAWLALWRGEAWVCWDAAIAGCWQRLELAGLVDVATLRAEFVDRSTLVLADRSATTWLIVRPDPTPRIAAWTTTPRTTPRPFACGSSGVLPVVNGAALSFSICDAPPDGDHCVRPGRPLRLRPASPLRLRVGLELRALDQRGQDRDLAGLAGSAVTGVQVLAVLAVGLDVAGWSNQQRERADLQAQARPGLRALPRSPRRGPLYAAEQQALRAVICGGAR